MPAIFNLGSCAIDHVYQVSHFVQPGETLLVDSYAVHPGGKGLNQSVAIARAGGRLRHLGKIGRDGQWLKDLLDSEGIDTSGLLVCDEPTGHASIQVSRDGENAITLFGGTNQQITVEEIERMLSGAASGDILVLQNETSELEATIAFAMAREMRIIFNAAPMTERVADLPLADLDTLIVNELEGESLAGAGDPDTLLGALHAKYPGVNILLTLGAAGARIAGPSGHHAVTAPGVEALDTTGAGDTFTGYFVQAYASNRPLDECLSIACRAAAISVTRRGAASSIPVASEVGTAA